MTAHINKLTSKAHFTQKACPPKPREIAYFSLVRSSLEYSSAVWDPFKKILTNYKKIQRSAARFVTPNYKKTASVTFRIYYASEVLLEYHFKVKF